MARDAGIPSGDRIGVFASVDPTTMRNFARTDQGRQQMIAGQMIAQQHGIELGIANAILTDAICTAPWSSV